MNPHSWARTLSCVDRVDFPWLGVDAYGLFPQGMVCMYRFIVSHSVVLGINELRWVMCILIFPQGKKIRDICDWQTVRCFYLFSQHIYRLLCRVLWQRHTSVWLWRAPAPLCCLADVSEEPEFSHQPKGRAGPGYVSDKSLNRKALSVVWWDCCGDHNKVYTTGGSNPECWLV